MKLKRLHLTLLSAMLISAPAFAQQNATLSRNVQATNSIPAADTTKVVATVNGQPIYKSELDYVIGYLSKDGVITDTPENRKQILDDLVTKKLFIEKAQKEKLQNDPNVQQKIKENTDNILIQALLDRYLEKNQPTERQLKAKYNDLVKQISNKEYNIEHILVKDESTANKIIAELNKGEKFSTLAKKYSIDQGSAKAGGHLGWARSSNFIEPFAKAVENTPAGKTTQVPVHTEFGWHIIHVIAVRKAAPPTFDQLQAQIKQQMIAQKISELKKQLAEKATISYDNK